MHEISRQNWKKQEKLGVITDNPWKELDTDLSQASEIKLIEADFTFKLLNRPNSDTYTHYQIDNLELVPISYIIEIETYLSQV